VFAEKKELPSSLLAPIEAKLHTGQAAGLSNGVKSGKEEVDSCGVPEI
jgi:hypothetical protein